MMKYLLALFFLIVYAGDRLGLSVSLAPGLSTKNLLVYAVLTGIAINAAVTRNRKIELAGAMTFFGLMILYALVTWITLTFVVQDPEYDVKGAFISLKSSLVDQFLTLLIFFYALLRLQDAMWLLRAIIWIAMLGNVITIIDTMNIPDLGLLPVPRKGGRFEGFIGQPNEYGLFLTFYLPACIALLVESRGKARLLAGIGVFATGLALILTGSRGSYVGVIAGSLVACFYLRRYVSAQTVVRAGTAVAVACAAVILTAFATGYADLFVDRFSGMEGTAHVATSGRSSIWSNAIESMLANPISFISGYGFYAYESDRSYRLATHNQYLYYLYDLGIIGVTLFIATYGRILSVARAAIAEAPEEPRRYLFALVFGVTCLLIAVFFNDYHDLGLLLWAYVGVAARIAMCVLSPEAAVSASALPASAAASGTPAAPERGAGRAGYQRPWMPHGSPGGRR